VNRARPAVGKERRRRQLTVEGLLLAALSIATIIMAQLSPHFLSVDNIFNITRFIAEVGIISLGMTAVILTGGIDLSVGSILGMSGIVLGALFAAGWDVWLAALAAVLVGGLAGLLNGIVVVATRVHSLVVTLATLAIYRGLALGISQGRSYRGFPESFFLLGQGYLGSVPVQLILFGVLAVVFGVLLGRTVFGRVLYASGHSETATLFSGNNVDRVKLVVFTLSGLLSGLAAVVFVSRVSSARGDAGQLVELDAITAVVLGGTALTGGRGSIWGTLLGLLLIGVVRNGLTLAFVPLEVQAVFVGAILILAVAANQWLRGGEA
jgi:rhamnose transport system permease protein